MRLFCVLCLCFLTGCALQQNKLSQGNKSPHAWLKPDVSVILPSSGLDKNINEQQLLTATLKGQSHSMIVLLEVNNEQLTLAGLSALGVRLFLLHYDQNGITTEQFIALPQLPPAEQVLADIMLSYWPTEKWYSVLPAGWSLIDKNKVRELRDDQQKLISQIIYADIDGNREPVRVNNYSFDYQIEISHLGKME